MFRVSCFEFRISTPWRAVVSSSIYRFLKDFGLAIISVILVTLLLLPKRVALVAASTIPISIFITLGIMWATGMDLQTVSLAGLIVVLGMVVDNAIVIIDNYRLYALHVETTPSKKPNPE